MSSLEIHLDNLINTIQQLPDVNINMIHYLNQARNQCNNMNYKEMYYFIRLSAQFSYGIGEQEEAYHNFFIQIFKELDNK